MLKTILIAPNSFKECADSVEVSRLIDQNLSSAGLRSILAPLSDGGDGFLKVCIERFGLEKLSFQSYSPLKEEIEVIAGYDRSRKVIYLESADIVGLKLVPPGKRNPMIFSTAGMGELLKIIAEEVKVDRFVIGIGGTATNDLGLGMLTKLGLKLYGSSGNIVDPVPQNFDRIKSFSWERDFNIPVTLISDVDNPLTGEKGAAFTYGSQKGFNPAEINFLDNEFERIAELFKKDGLINQNTFLSGSGGGLSAGMQIFLNASVKHSEHFILEDLGLREYFQRADFIVTGEGAFDYQSYNGKGAGVILRHTQKHVFLICGKIAEGIKLPDNVYPIELEEFFEVKSDSISHFSMGIRYAAERVLELIAEITWKKF
jgi:glycerate 2-kinase